MGVDPLTERMQTPPAGWDAESNSLSDLMVTLDDKPIDKPADWTPKRSALKTTWSFFFGRGPTHPPPLKLEVLELSRQVDHVRQLIRYQVEKGVFVRAYLLLPNNPHPKRLGVVDLHPTTDDTIRQEAGVVGEPEKQLGLRLVQRGYAVICPENYLWIQGKPRLKESVDELFAREPKWNGMAKMIWDGSRAIDVLIAGKHCDPERIGCIGHSLGAKEALYLAAFDHRIAAAISSEGGIGLTFSNWHDRWYLGQRIQAEGFRRENHEVLALVAPRPFLLLGGDGADGDKSWAFIERVLPVYRLLDAGDNVGMINHHRGHRFSPDMQRIAFDWLDRQLTK
jgi:hypothetical protein